MSARVAIGTLLNGPGASGTGVSGTGVSGMGANGTMASGAGRNVADGRSRSDPARRQTGERLLDAGPRARVAPRPASIARHRALVAAAKWLLPAGALLLLAAIALWPEYSRVAEQGRIAFRRVFAIDPESGRLLKPRYRGVDQRGRPYTFTAASAQQTSPERVALTDPKGDIVTESGSWVMVQAKRGVYIQHQSILDLSHDVVLYREDGTTLRTQSAEVDLKAGAAAGNVQTHSEGPFGVLDAQGFTLVDKGAVIQFQGPAHLVLNGGGPP